MSNVAKVGAKVSKTARRADRKNTSNLRVAVEDDSAVFGRVTKILGNRRFLVTYWDAKSRRHVADIQASIAKKKVRIDINDIVNIAGSGKDWEIQAQIDTKAASKLKKEGRLSAELLLSAEAAHEKSVGDVVEFIYDDDDSPKAEGELEDGEIDDI